MADHDKSDVALHVWYHIHSALLAIIMLFSIVLNSLLIIVLKKMKSRRSKKDCASSNIERSYMYLLFHLAFADMLAVVLNIPFDIIGNIGISYHTSLIGCKFLGPSQLASTTAQAGTYVALSYHRFRAIVYPIRANLTVCKSILMICIVWGISFCLSLPFVLVLRLNETNCTEKWPHKDLSSMIYTFSIFSVQYAAPVALMAVFYISIAKALHHHRIAKELVQVPTQDDIRSHHHIVKMLVTIVTVYSVCMLPHNLFWIINEFNTMPEYSYDIIGSIAYLFTYSNSVANPVIFFWYNKESRYHLRRFCLKFCCCSRNMEVPFEIRISKWSATWSGNSKTDSSNPHEGKHIAKADDVKLNPFKAKPGDSDMGVSLPWEAQILNSHTSCNDEYQDITRDALPLPAQNTFVYTSYPPASPFDKVVPRNDCSPPQGETPGLVEPSEIATEEGEKAPEKVDRVLSFDDVKEEEEEESSSEDETKRVEDLIKKMMDDITFEMTNNADNGFNRFDHFSLLKDSSSTIELETGDETEPDHDSVTCLGPQKVFSSQDLIKDMISLLENSPQETEGDMSALREHLKNLPETRM